VTFEIVSYQDALVDGVVSVFNRETAESPFVVALSADLFREQIAGKSLFDPDACFVAVERGKAIGFALACEVKSPRVKPEDTEGVIDGAFFPVDRTDVGHALIAACMEYLRGRGARVIWGFASHGGYPFWRGLYCGAEPVCLTAYVQGWTEFLAHGFTHHQQSVNYLGEPCAMPYRKDLDYAVEDLAISQPWAADSWRGHHPKEIVASLNGRRIGHVGFVEMPFMSDYRGKKFFGIHGFAVHKQHRRKQVGSSLLSKLWEITGDLGGKEILVGTTVENAPARRTYETAGMKLVGARSGTVWRGSAAPGP